jgi:hypothetical protein
MTYDALNAFNRAGKLAHKKDIELEAISEGYIGRIWFKALKNNLKAKPHLYNCLRLSNLLFPKIVTEEAWYKHASKQL